MNELIKKVVILGGGTAGWMTASYISKAFGKQVKIVLIESLQVPKIGVGEATVPNLQRVFFDFLEIPESEWMRECNASFKGAVKFVNWRKKEKSQTDNHFYHHFGLIPNCDGIPLSQYWTLKKMSGEDVLPIDYACYPQGVVLDANLSPQHLGGKSAFAYAWHFDAHLVADYLAKLSIGWGVERVIDDFLNVEYCADGNIQALLTKTGGRYEADFFIDCSGFKGLLINQALKEPFIDMNNHLFCNSAVASPVAHDDERNGIEPYTSAIAMKHGWTWKIPMLGRFGSGYVYSNDFVSQDEATDEFIKLWNLNPATAKFNHIRFRTGRNRRAWVGNCVSIGLSSCFLEPLESTGIYFITASIYQLVKHFPDKSFNPILRNRFNEEIEVMFDDCRDFVQSHYFNTSRDDTDFWLANKNSMHLSENIKRKIDTYKSGLPVNIPLTTESNYYENFEAEFNNFWTNSSYYCVYAGMNFFPDQPMPKIRYRIEAMEKANVMFDRIQHNANALIAELPSCYERLKELHKK